MKDIWTEMVDGEQPVLLVDDEEHILLSYSLMLKSSGISSVVTVSDSREVLPVLNDTGVAAVVLDLIMPYISGEKLLGRIKQEFPHIPVTVMTARNDIENAVECMKNGAFDYLVKPVEKSRFVSCVRKSLEISALSEEVAYLRQHMMSGSLENEEAFSHIITISNKMYAIFQYLEAVVKTRRPIFIYGETGAGKELLAQSIFSLSGLRGKFIPVNVAGLDDTIFSDTLFGHARGAYTGADNERDGLVEKAAGGILYLDEIGDLSKVSQLKLLRLIEEKTYYPLGSDIPKKSSARIIASTNMDIKKAVSEGAFRRDLYYRLSAHSVDIPPLRERAEDIPLLLDHFVTAAAGSLSKKKPYYPPELVTLLSSYHFPGNIRELQAMVYDAVAQNSSGRLTLNSFSNTMKENVTFDHPPAPLQNSAGITLSAQSGRFPTLKEAEQFLISEAIRRAKGNQGIAASLLGISRQALNNRLRRSGTSGPET